MDKDIEEKWQNFFKTLEPRIIKLENSYEDRVIYFVVKLKVLNLINLLNVSIFH